MNLNFDCALLTAPDIYAADKSAHRQGITPFDLMIRAGQALTTAILQRYPLSKTLVFCGPGNNGGDGYVVARLLAERHWPVTVCAFQGETPKSQPARAQAKLWDNKIYDFTKLSIDEIKKYDLIIDAGFGVGLTRELNNQWELFIQKVNKSACPVIAIDIPTGVTDKGQLICKMPIKASITLTLFKKKLAHVLAPGRHYCQNTVVCDIGLNLAHIDSPIYFYENKPSFWYSYWLNSLPDETNHKYNRGQVIILGGHKYPGAASLAAYGAAYSGAGLVRILCHPKVWPVFAAQMRSIMAHTIHDIAGFSYWIAEHKTNAAVIGPGAVEINNLTKYIKIVLSAQIPCVLDAQALNIIAENPKEFFPLLHEQVVLTPHEGEFNRLFPNLTQDNSLDRLQKAQQAAKLVQAVVVLKGAETLIAAPTGQVAINIKASPYLATAGTGDVLSGVIGAFLAQGVPSFFAAAIGVWLHGQAGLLAGIGLIADDLPKWLIKAQQILLDNKDEAFYS